MLTDTHCHLASHRYSPEEMEEVITRAQKAKVARMVTLATGIEDLQQNIDLAEKYPSVYAGIGIHPCDVTEAPNDAVAKLRTHLPHPKVVVIGEAGLDYYHPAPEGWDEEAYHQRQRDFLKQQFELAPVSNLNIVIHTRDKAGAQSFYDCLEIYKEYSSQLKAVFHCFSGTFEQAQEVITLGGLVSFTGNVTFKSAHLIKEVAQKLPLGSFMLETDAPYLSPTPHRGKRNEPARVRDIATYISL